MVKIERILCPTDLTPESGEALRYAVALARVYGAKLLLCHCGREATAAAAVAGAPDVVAVDNPKGGGKRLVRLETISIAQANGDYARIVCDDGRFLLRTPLSQLEKDWAQSGFARVHRAYLVNLTHAVELRAQLNGTAVLIMRDGTEVPVARRNVAALRRRLHA
jgi:DNA-binding LytR/AlgR family response regulator